MQDFELAHQAVAGMHLDARSPATIGDWPGRRSSSAKIERAAGAPAPCRGKRRARRGRRPVANILSFGPGIRPEDLRYSEENGDLVIEFANRPGDKVVLRGYMPGRATQTRSVDVIRFADGTEIVADTIEPTGKTETAGEEGGGLYGTPFADTLVGGDGDDVIYGEGGSMFW